MRLLHAVTRDIPEIPDDNFVAMIKAIEPFVDYIQLREKSRAPKSLGRLITLILEANVPVEKLIVNDRADIAAAFEIPRTHLTEKSLSVFRLKDAFPEMKFGRSFHSVRAIERELIHYDYGYLGHIFRTSEKSYPALGIEPLMAAYQSVHDDSQSMKNTTTAHKKLIAIGGIDLDTLPKIKAYIDGAAVMSALFPVVNHRFDIERGRTRAKALRDLLNSPMS